MSTQSIVVCVSQAAVPSAVAGPPCPAGQGLAVVQGLVVAPSDPLFDPLVEGEFFMYGFGVVVFFWLIGITFQAVRRPILQGRS